MKKPGRNDPCPCGSGKKYKQCCLQAETIAQTGHRSDAVPRAINWLMAKYGQAVHDAIDNGFFGGLQDDEYESLQERHRDDFDHFLINAMEWLIAEGHLTIKGQEQRVVALLLGLGGPLFSAEQRQWIELLATHALRLYEIVAVEPGECMTLKDLFVSDDAPIVVLERSGSRGAQIYDLLAARVIPIDGHRELSGAVYSIPRQRSFELLEELRIELGGIAPDSPIAREVMSAIVRDYWLKLFAIPFELPPLVDATTGEPILLITDHYHVEDWHALEQALANAADVDGDRKVGWSRTVEGDDKIRRSRLAINPTSRPDRLTVFYRTQRYADEGRPWFERISDSAVRFISRELTDPKGMLANMRSEERSSRAPAVELPAEIITALIEKQIRQLYANGVDEPVPALTGQTPREAIRTPAGLEQVKFLLNSYTHGEIQQAADQQRKPVSFEFLWHELAIAP